MTDHERIQRIIKAFFEKTVSIHVVLKDDQIWPQVAHDLSDTLNIDDKIAFWTGLEKEFRNLEKASTHLHKGQIYWVLANLHLSLGDLRQCLEYLKQSRDEDNVRNENQFTASKGLLSILGVMVYRYKQGRSWVEDQEAFRLYESLSASDKHEFADRIWTIHNNLAGRMSMTVIKDDFFNFINDPTTRRVLYDTYKEVMRVITETNLSTYYSSVFAIGSIAEAMLDDLFTRGSGHVWKVFHENANIQKQLHKESSLRHEDYIMGMNLGQKIKALEFMVREECNPILAPSVLQLKIIGEYRDLIHPQRRLEFEHEANKYVVMALFTFISNIASDLWPSNVERLLNRSDDKPAGKSE